jgi:hypothetical protein
VSASDFTTGRSWLYAGYFAAIALISLAQPMLASYLMFGLIIVSRVAHRL